MPTIFVQATRQWLDFEAAKHDVAFCDWISVFTTFRHPGRFLVVVVVGA
jgi:hypothetical protein